MTLFVVIKIQVECRDDQLDSIADIADIVGSDCDYSLSYKSDDYEIVATELVACQPDSPL